MKGLVKPRRARGMRDLLPEQMLARTRMVDTIREVYELYGFVPLETPAVEYLDVLTGSAGEEALASLFRVHNPDSHDVAEALGMRFDLTVPLARVVAEYQDLPSPFRRYQVSPVWRADKPDKGRYREFMQFDLDSVGVETELADAEIIAAMCDTLSALKVGKYVVRFSSRALLDVLLEYAGIDASRGPDVFRVLDKLEKIGAEKVRRELTTGYTDRSGDPIEGLGLETRQVERIERFLAIRGDERAEVIARVRRLFSDLPSADEAVDTVESISRVLDELGYGSDRVILDLSVARGLAYYTGPVFEAYLPGAERFGSVFSGGRYDDLVTRYLGRKVPATGASIGVDRLLAALDELDRIERRRSTANVLVTVLDRELSDDYLALVFELRRNGVSAELYLGTGKLGKQLGYADACQVPISLIMGADEAAEDSVTLKDMAAGRERSKHVKGHDEWLRERPAQRRVPRRDLVATVREMLAQIDARGH